MLITRPLQDANVVVEGFRMEVAPLQRGARILSDYFLKLLEDKSMGAGSLAIEVDTAVGNS